MARFKKRWVKKLACLLAVLLGLVSFSSPVLAVSTALHRLSDLNMSIYIPPDYTVFTRDISENDSNLSIVGMTKDDVLKYLESENMYLNAFSTEFSSTIAVIGDKSATGSEDFKDLSGTELASYESTLLEQIEAEGMLYEDSEIYEHPQATFVKISYTETSNEGTTYSTRYYTMIKDEFIIVMFMSKNKETSSSMDSLNDIVMSSIFFTFPSTTSEPSTPPNSNLASENQDAYSTVPNMLKAMYGLPLDTSNGTLFLTMIINLLLTIALYSLPIIIYRYGIKKQPISPTKAKEITFVYGFIAFIIAVWLGSSAGDKSPGGAVLLWSYFNYRILVGGAGKSLNNGFEPKKQSNYTLKTQNYPKSTRWLWFYIFISFPLSIINVFIDFYKVLGKFYSIYEQISGGEYYISNYSIFVEIIIIAFLEAVGLTLQIYTFFALKSLTQRGYLCNMAVMFYAIAFYFLLLCFQVSSDSIRSETIGALIIRIIWLIPNFYYFRKRKDLFCEAPNTYSDSNPACQSNYAQEQPKISEPSPAAPPAPEDSSALYCHKCGVRLPEESVYCPRCGAKIG